MEFLKYVLQTEINLKKESDIQSLRITFVC